MEFKSDSVSADLFYDRIAVFPGMSVDRMRDITEMSPRFCGRKSEVDAFLCYADDFFGSFGNRSELKHTGGVGKVAV